MPSVSQYCPDPFYALITPVKAPTPPTQPPGSGNYPSHPIALPGDPWWGSQNPVDPGYSPPWAQVPPGTRPPSQGPVDPGYSPPWAQIPPGSPGTPGWNVPHPSHPIMLPGMPGWGLVPIRPPSGPVDPGYSPPWAQVPPPVDPGYSPPWAQVPGTTPPPVVPEKPPEPTEPLTPGGTSPTVPPTFDTSKPVLVFVPPPVAAYYWVQLATVPPQG